MNQIMETISDPNDTYIYAIFMSSVICDDQAFDGIANICGRNYFDGDGDNCYAWVRHQPYGTNDAFGSLKGRPVLTHELGHTLGLTHSGSWEISGGREVVVEYGDVWSAMGNPTTPRLVGFAHRYLLGWYKEYPKLVKRLVPKSGPNATTFALTLLDINAPSIPENPDEGEVFGAYFLRNPSYQTTKTNYVLAYQQSYTVAGFTGAASVSLHFVGAKNKDFGAGILEVDETNEVKLVWRTQGNTCQFPKNTWGSPTDFPCQTMEWTDQKGGKN